MMLYGCQPSGGKSSQKGKAASARGGGDIIYQGSRLPENGANSRVEMARPGDCKRSSLQPSARFL